MTDKKIEKLYKVFTIILLFLLIIFLLLEVSRQSLDYDELDWTIRLIKTNFFDMIRMLLKSSFNLPLYYLIEYPIYHIYPYSQLWLSIPNFIILILGIFIMRKIGNKIGGKDLSFICFSLTLTSYILIYQGAFQIRPYTLLFTTSSWTLYRYLIYIEDKNKKNTILYTLSLLLLVYTHWFGCLIIPMYFINDLSHNFKKKKFLKLIIPYISLFLLFLPWLIFMLINNVVSYTSYWASSPNYKSIIKTISYLLSRNIICEILFYLGIILFIRLSFSKKNNKYKKILELSFNTILWTIGLIFLYSRYLIPGGSLFVKRYFIVLIPYLFIIISITIEYIINKIISLKDKNKINSFDNKIFKFIIIIICISVILVKNYHYVHINMGKIKDPYKEISLKITKIKDLYQEDSALFTSEGKEYLNYYIKLRNKEFPNNVFYRDDKNIVFIIKNQKLLNKFVEKEKLLEYDKLYVAEIHTKLTKEMSNFINNNYKLIEHDKKLNFYIYKKIIK